MNANIEMPVFRGPVSSVPRVGPACPLPATPGLPVRSVNGHLPDRTGAVALVLGDLVDPGSAGATRTLADYNISDAKIENGVITLGPSSVMLSDFAPASRLSGHLADLLNPHQVTKSQVGLGNVDNTPDADKPVSTAQHNAIAALRTAMTEADDSLRSQINEKYEKPSGGIPKTDLAPAVQTSLDKADTALQSHQDISGKADKSDTYTKSQTDEAIAGAISAVKDSAPEAFDTLKEIADWIQDDQSGAAAMAAAIANKVDKVPGKGLSTNDYDATEKGKVASALQPADIDPTLSVEGAAADAKATGDAVTLTPVYSQTPTFSEWTYSQDPEIPNVYWDVYDTHEDEWGLIEVPDGETVESLISEGQLGNHLSGTSAGGSDAVFLDFGSVTATRTRTDIVGYTLGTQTTKPLQPKGDYALLSQLYEAVRNLAPDFTAESYALNDLCTYNGVFYRCKSAITGMASTPPPEDPEHWEAKKASELFLPLTGGDVAGTVRFGSYDSILIDNITGLACISTPDGQARFLDVVMAANGNSAAYAKPADIGIPAFSTAKTYALGAKVVYDNVLWNCTAAVSTAGAWTGTTNWAKLFDLDTGAPASSGTKLITNGQVHTALQGKADADDLRYDLPANATAISSASSEVVEGETVTYGEATLADRTANRVTVTAAIAELRLAFPAAVSGKVRDFGLRMEVGDGTTALTAPALVPPAGVTLENSDGEIPALADGTATAKGVTLLYFSETAPGVFLVKGEEVKEA